MCFDALNVNDVEQLEGPTGEVTSIAISSSGQ